MSALYLIIALVGLALTVSALVALGESQWYWYFALFFGIASLVIAGAMEAVHKIKKIVRHGATVVAEGVAPVVQTVKGASSFLSSPKQTIKSALFRDDDKDNAETNH